MVWPSSGVKCRVISRPRRQQVRKSPLTKKHYGAGMGEALKLELLDMIEDDFAAGGLDVLFNYDTDQLLGARDSAYNATNLRRPDAAARIPRDSCGVGHFVPLIGLWRRPAGDRWLVILNSFKARAFAGVEPQPADLMRRAVLREDGRGGGVLLSVPSERAAALIDRVETTGLEVRSWSNGSREPGDWRWSPGHLRLSRRPRPLPRSRPRC